MEYPDKHGVYRVGDLKFYSKLEAIECMQKTGIHLHWDFNEAVFDSYNWTVEPTENILKLYCQRAQQLRDKYDYIILMYSGGADSATVLESFVDNDIKLDEVVSHINYNATGDKSSWMNTEVFNVAAERMEQVKQKYPYIKYRLLDLTELILDHFQENKTNFDWIYKSNMYLNPNCACKESLPLKIKEWADIIHSGKKLCMLWGHDKPRIHYDNGRFSMRFIDFIDSGPTVKSIAGQQPYTDELFYWTPDLPNLVIKQAHLIKNYLSTPEVNKLPFISTEKSDLAFITIKNKKYWLSNHGMHKLIYPNWNIDTFAIGKNSSIIFTPRDSWFFNLEQSHQAKKTWQVGLEKFWQVIPDYWKNNTKDLSKSIKACWSKHYYLN